MQTLIPSRFLCFARRGGLDKAPAHFRLAALLAIAAVTAMTAETAFAQIAAGTTGIDNTGNAQSEMATCNNGKTQQARDTCMTEVRNANGEKRAGKLGANGDFSANAMKRCDVFKDADDQAACKARVTGENKAQGGVAGGGVLRETQTVVPAAAQ
jgi:hypothetical protein